MHRWSLILILVLITIYFRVHIPDFDSSLSGTRIFRRQTPITARFAAQPNIHS
ncbi:hypothetical protein NEOLEDRAFT_1138094 [Neolentinus lepideus HHB14362 ss-1]|uniref:Uncharacterized protein n=1 Tax=Neolentinus lepideus HHB14362 ss-1 TaxID=1314782 RepID=A0A165QGG8_9AGAM|nr:hypothetical protein NEOLEDRAFT_1138094 [Neolentinus lepideus HHB14362 ss-1]